MDDILKALHENPSLFQIAGARRKVLWFAQYVKPSYVTTDFHLAYSRVLDYFAQGKIKNLIIQAPPQHGKALHVDTPVLTTRGWKRHVDLRVGDYVFGLDGKPKAVIANSGGYIHECQEVVFADGFSLIAAREHEWEVWRDHDNGKGRVREIVETQDIFGCRNRRNPAITANVVLETEQSHLPIDPYLLGVWLGDGNKYDKWISCGEQDINHLLPLACKVKRDKTAYRVYLNGLETKGLAQLHLLYNKHIPMRYMLASREDRLRLLQGLMDTDGYTDKNGGCEFCQKKGRLADDVYVLIRSLGYKPSKREYTAFLYGKDCGKKVRITFRPNKGDKIFDIPRKQERVDNKPQPDREDKNKFFITSVNDFGLCEVNCIQVEGGMYLAGEQLVPTHNSELSSRMLPAFMLGLNPDLKIVIASYAATIAKDFNRDVQRIIDSEEYHSVFPDTCLNNSNVVSLAEGYLRNSDVFEVVNHNGSLRVVGRGGSLTSKTADVMIFDDLYKDASEANSPIVRESAWDWYTKVARTRLHNNSQQLIVFTRWHSEDIIGKIIDSEPVIFAKEWKDLDNAGDAWVLVNFEAIKTSPPSEIDPRQEGEVLWPERHSKEKILAQKALDPQGFMCLYQGDPSSAEGRLYQPFKTYSEKSEYGKYIRSGCCVDVADEGSDFLAAVCYDVYQSDNTFYNENTRRYEPLLFALVTDIEYTDAPSDVTLVTVARMINQNNVQRVWVESNNGGAQYEKQLKKKVRAVTMPYHESSNKESRIITNAPFVNAQIVFPLMWEERYPKAYEHLTNFLRAFSANAHDDFEDVLCAVYLKELSNGDTKGYGRGKRGVRY